MNSILLVGQTPPPYHGQAIAMQQLFDHRWEGLKIQYLRMEYSQREAEVGRFRIKKIFHLFSLIIRSWFILIKNRPCCLYYPPASPNRIPVIRDVVFLLFVRPLAKGKYKSMGPLVNDSDNDGVIDSLDADPF